MARNNRPDGKRTLALSGTSVFREKPPANPKLAERIPCFAWDYTKPMPLYQDTKPAFIENTPNSIFKRSTYKPLNEHGAPLRLASTTGAVKRPSGPMYMGPRSNSKRGVTKASRGGRNAYPGARPPTTEHKQKRGP